MKTSSQKSDGTGQIILETRQVGAPTPSTAPGPTLGTNSGKLEIDSNFLSNGASVGASIPGLKGRCVSGLKVMPTGDVQDGQSTDCENDSFVFADFLLTDGDGEKVFTLKQSENGVALYESKPMKVVRTTTKIFKLPQDVVHPSPLHGFFANALHEISLQGELLIASFKEGGIAISRDLGKSWYSKSHAHGISSSAPQKPLLFGNKYFLTSDYGLFESNDMGKTWQSTTSPSLLGSDGKPLPIWNIYANENSLFVELPAGITKISSDSGQTWKQLASLPPSQNAYHWMNIGNDVYVSSKLGVYAFKKSDLSWTLVTTPDQSLNRRVRSLRGLNELRVLTMTDWPQTTANPPRTFYVSTNSGQNWTEMFTSNSATETVEIVAGKLIRFDNNASELEVSVSQDSGATWQEIALPSVLTDDADTDRLQVLFNGEALAIANQTKLAITNSQLLTSWTTQVIPPAFQRATLLNFKTLGSQKFLTFDQGLLFSDKNSESWNIIPILQATGSNVQGIQSKEEHILTWSLRGWGAEPAGLFQSKNGGRTFENILARLNLLNGYYSFNSTFTGSMRFDRGGYFSPIDDIALTEEKLFISTPEGITQSSDRGASFQNVTDPSGRRMSAARDIDAQGQRISILTQENRLFLSSDEGKTWKSSNAPYLLSSPAKQVSLLEKNVFLLAENEIFLSEDFGESWKNFLRDPRFPDGELISFKIKTKKIFIVTRKLVREQGVTSPQLYLSVMENLSGGIKSEKIPREAGLVEHIDMVGEEIVVAGPDHAMAASKDLKIWRSIAKSLGAITGLQSTKGTLYIASSTGLYVTSPRVPVTAEEIPESAKVSKPIELAQCHPECPSATNPNQANTSGPGSAMPTPSTPPVIDISSCSWNFQTQKCEYTLSWSNAPENACLWVKIVDSSPKLRACARADDPTSGSLFLSFVEQRKNYTFFLAPVLYNAPGAIIAQRSKIFKPEIHLSNCTIFNDISPDLCTAQIRWENAPSGACLWGINPLTERTWLAACSNGINPSAMTLNFQWMYFGKTNKFFLALQSSNPLIPLGTYRDAEAEIYQPEPSNFAGYVGRIHHFCPQDSCKNLVMGVIENYSMSSGVASGWACQKNVAASVNVDVYINADETKPTFAAQNPSSIVLAATGTANLASEAGISTECGTTGLGHRFSITIPSAMRAAYPNTKLLVMGKNSLTTNGTPNRELYDFYKVTFPNRVKGNIDSYTSATGVIAGWACQTGVASSIQIQLYAGASASTATLVKTATANISSEAGIGAECGTTLGLHRFQIPLTSAEKAANLNKKIYIRGVDTIRNDIQWNLEIGNSGNLTIN